MIQLHTIIWGSSLSVLLCRDFVALVRSREGWVLAAAGEGEGQVDGWQGKGSGEVWWGFLGGTWVSLSPVSNLLLVISFWSLSAAVHLALTSWHTQQATCQHSVWGRFDREREWRQGRDWKVREGANAVCGGEGERLEAMTLSRGHCAEVCWWSSLAPGR